MKFDIARAWKDATYRQSLSAEEQALLPANPAGELELTDADLAAIHGTHEEEEGGQHGINTAALLCLQTVLLLQVCITMSANGNCG